MTLAVMLLTTLLKGSGGHSRGVAGFMLFVVIVWCIICFAAAFWPWRRR